MLPFACPMLMWFCRSFTTMFRKFHAKNHGGLQSYFAKICGYIFFFWFFNLFFPWNFQNRLNYSLFNPWFHSPPWWGEKGTAYRSENCKNVGNVKCKRHVKSWRYLGRRREGIRGDGYDLNVKRIYLWNVSDTCASWRSCCCWLEKYFR